MLKILIAEDENFERKAIKYLISKQLKEEEYTVKEASNGQEALDISIVFKPDIVLMDISMPIMNGLEATGKIKDINDEVEIVILTAFDEFEYARQAIKNGVSDYLVKPYSDEDFYESLDSTIKNVRDKRQIGLDNLNIIKNYNNAIPFVEKEFITQLIYGDYSECCKIEMSKNILEIEAHKATSIIIGTEGVHIYKENSLLIIKNYFESIFDKVVAARLLDDIVVFVFDENLEQIILSNKMAEIFSLIKNHFMQNEETLVRIGIGTIADNIEEYGDSYNNARLDLKDKLNSKNSNNSKQAANYNEIESIISGKIMNEDLNGAMVQIKILLDSILNEIKDTEISTIKSIIYDHLININNNVFNFTDADNNIITDDNIKDELKSLQTISDIGNYLSVFNRRLVNIVSEYKNTNNIEIVNNAKKYINHNFMNDISLEDVAKEVGISSFYFSRIFKKFEGVNYIQYLTKVKMEKAKKLLIEDKLQIKEIAQKVGYVDQNYFSRSFKKYTGESPTEFTNKYKKLKMDIIS